MTFGPDANVRWKTPSPPGHSSPVVTSSRIFLTAHSAEKVDYQLFVIALDRANGRELWRREVPRGGSKAGGRTSTARPPQPGHRRHQRLRILPGLRLHRLRTGWPRAMAPAAGPFDMFYGFGALAVLVDDTPVLAVDQDADACLLALDAATGKQRWKVSRPHVISGYSTPTIYRPPNGETT